MTKTPGGAEAEIARLKERIASLEGGECRFHCRVRADMWKAGGAYVYENWHKCARPAPVHLDQMYKEWRKGNGHTDNETT